ncbi:NAD-dependent protein deacetylase hst2-1 [Psilocybe cubensis]|uniref:NAD-dependent protein deacetylase n=2 Tax=Psilocybe cubensis TaxID=181762 RepID=A0A8H7XQH7_PSICU|nr:NAD-dependent protein deacetylase hst2-1 [Psilocybe cubensis]KAH9480735.1 NAD-dependent protein deacetylase hst2-1 [Psilocybe cubensis]
MSYRYRNRRDKPQVLEGRDISSLAKYIKSTGCKNVVLMLGAGVSTSAGIPDFRSPETGLYSNLARLNLPHPEAVFEISFFRKQPVPFYTLAHELYPGKFRPTITHSFIRLLAEKSLLHTCFTQNIDTLERRAGVPDDKIIEAHGSFAGQRCIECKQPYDDEKMKEHIFSMKIAKCEHCGGYVKPDIVFFGEELPEKFIRAIPNLRSADLLIIMGTSLTVYPFASLAQRVDESCPRVLINLDHVGDIGSRADDIVLLGKCDDVVKDLCVELGWEDELIKLWNETEDSVVSDKQKDSDPKPTTTDPEPTTRTSLDIKKPDALNEIEKQFSQLELDANDNPSRSRTDSTTGSKEKVATEDVPSVSPAESSTNKEKSTSKAPETESTSSQSSAAPIIETEVEERSTSVDNKL